MKNRESIARKVSEELGISKEQVEQIAKVQFEYVVTEMESGKYLGVRLPYFGVFCAKPTRILKLYQNGYSFTEEVLQRIQKDEQQRPE